MTRIVDCHGPGGIMTSSLSACSCVITQNQKALNAAGGKVRIILQGYTDIEFTTRWITETTGGRCVIMNRVAGIIVDEIYIATSPEITLNVSYVLELKSRMGNVVLWASSRQPRTDEGYYHAQQEA